MSTEQQVQEAASINLGILRRFSRSTGGSTGTPTTSPNGVNAFRDVVADDASTVSLSRSGRSRSTAFAKLKSHLGRRTRRLKGKTVEEGRPKTLKGTVETLESALDETAVESTCGAASSSVEPPYISGEEHTSGVENAASRNTSDPQPATGISGGDDAQTISAATLARRIQSLLSSLPPFCSFSQSGSLRPLKTSDPRTSDAGAGAPLADSKLLSLLSSASVMNGSISKGRESVWAVLERLGYSPHPKTAEARETDAGASSAPESDENVEVSSVMICCPLQPTEDTEVEIARSEVVSVDMDETADESAETPQPENLEQKAGLNIWPFGREKGKGKGKSKTEATPDESKSPPKRIKEVRVWFPSRTKVSLQAAWWGYRIYLPPPVMRVLNDTSLEAAKRAAMITAALTWLVAHIPATMLPPQLKAVVNVVKGIVPIVGYVGGFIAWSWNTVQGFDKGQGVILSATWLLPIALVPGTWHYTEPSAHNDTGD